MDGEALEAIRALLPGWVGVAPLLIWAPAAWLISRWATALVARVAIGPYRRLPPDAHWTERARRAWPARLGTALYSWLAPALLGVLAARSGGELSVLPPVLLGIAVAASAWLGVATERVHLGRELAVGPQRVGELARDELVYLLLAASHALIPLLVAPAIRAPLDLWDAAVFAALALLFHALARGGVLTALGWLRLTEPAPPHLLRAVDDAARALGAPTPPVTVVRWGAANAIAFPSAGRLAFSTRALELLDEADLALVAGHEIGHLTEPTPVRLARLGMLFALLPLAGVFAAWQLMGPLGALVPLVVVVLLAAGFRTVAMRMEQRADEAAHRMGPSPRYAGALVRIYQANLVPAVMSANQVHPHLYDRELAAGATPDYPRPEPPSARRLRWATLASFAWLVPATATVAALPILLTGPALHDRSASDLVIALEAGSQPLLRRALFEHARGDPAAVLAFARAATAVDPVRHEPLALAAMALGHQGRCDEAQTVLDTGAHSAPDDSADPWILSAQASVSHCVESPTAALLPR